MNKAVLLLGERSARLEDVEPPELLPGTLIIDVAYCGIGGSDVEAWIEGSVPHSAWFGHEWSGTVAEIGPEVVGHFKGQRVVGAVGAACGRCQACEASFPHHCMTALQQIVGADPLASSHGAFAHQIRVDSRRVLGIPDALDTRIAALTEPAAVAVHAVSRAGPVLGDTVVVVGAGTIGLLVAELSRIAGAAHVVAVDPDVRRRELACDLGADAAFSDTNEELAAWTKSHGNGLGADVVYVCVSSSPALSAAMVVAGPGGSVVSVGVGDRRGSVAGLPLLEREVSLRTSLGYSRQDAQRALRLMSADRLRVRPLMASDAVALAQLPDAFIRLTSDGSERPKTLVQSTGAALPGS